GELVELLELRAPSELGARLAAAITPRVASTMTNVAELATLDDPRVSRWAIDQLALLPFTAPSALPLLQAILELVKRHADPRVHARADTIRMALRTRIGRLAMRITLAFTFEKYLEQIPAHPPEDPEATAREAALARLLEPLRRSTRTAASLLADIHADPADDAPRLVYADLLAEQGDPRGELIALQLGRAPDAPASARELELLKKHGKQWLGALAPVLSWGRGYSGTVFRRGFVATADIIGSVGKKLAPLLEEPGWATVELLEGSWTWELLTVAPLTGLREFDKPINLPELAPLARRAVPLPVTTVRIGAIDPELGVALRAAFPRLTTVRLWAMTLRNQPLEVIAALGVPHVEITHNWYEVADLARGEAEHRGALARLVGRPAFVDQLTLGGPYSRHQEEPRATVLVRDGAGRFAERR
ncbi:MAG: TIGR02996 domain-containing protein, partial [Proteobacteria bacterium]|nr:TIGR02996 domain-containing protein [Pseudomonadota bacterium]